MSKSFKYYLLHKPYGVLSQFTKEVESHITLADYITIEKDIYPVGRLDKDSEGLLLLTNDNALKTKLLSPTSKKTKTYLAQVDGDINNEAISRLKNGVDIKVNKNIYHTLPAEVCKINSPNLTPRIPPVRYRVEIPTSWIEIKIHEGKNRQIRRMCAAVGFPVIRLVRTAICDLDIDLPVGTFIELKDNHLSLL